MALQEFLKNNTTLIIAIYGAILSTIGMIWNIYKGSQDKSKIKINARIGFISQGGKSSEPLLLIEAINHGRRAVFLSSVGIRLTRNEDIAMMNVRLPIELKEGKSHTEWIEIEKLRKESCEFAWYKDETGKLYKSQNINKKLNRYFNPPENRKSKPIDIRPLN